MNICADPWIPRIYSRRIITPQRGSLLQKVADLINPVTGSWDKQLIRDTFWEEDAKFIMAMPLFQDMDDSPAWHPDPRAFFQSNRPLLLELDSETNKMGPTNRLLQMCPVALIGRKFGGWILLIR